MNDESIRLIVYSRQGCHLCDDMIKALEGLQQQYSFLINIIDIDADELLLEKYAGEIPVLSSGDIDICNYYLDENALKQFLAEYQ